MKVQCGQCPAKYAVSDERVRDKKVRIHCKRCHASIVVDGKVDPPLVTSTPARRSVRPTPSSPPGLDSLPPPEPQPESRPSPRPVAHTIMGGLEAPAAERLRAREAAGAEPSPDTTGMPAPDRGFTDPPAGTNPDRWRVALTRQDLRWMTTPEIVEAYRAGAVKLETFVFRTGMPNWVTLAEVREIASALGEQAEDSLEVVNGLSPSSLPPPRKSPPSRPPPRPAAAQLNGMHAGVEEVDAADPMPFALVSERASNGRKEGAKESAISGAAPGLPQSLGGPAPTEEAPLASPAQQPEPAPFAQSPLVAQAKSSKTWLWVIIAVALLAVVAAVVGPRLGLF